MLVVIAFVEALVVLVVEKVILSCVSPGFAFVSPNKFPPPTPPPFLVECMNFHRGISAATTDHPTW